MSENDILFQPHVFGFYTVHVTPFHSLFTLILSVYFIQSFPLLPCAPLSLPELQELVVFMALLIGAAVAFLGI